MNTERERADFEAWAADKWPGADFSPDQNNCGIVVFERYKHPKLQAAWEAYQAGRSALQSQAREGAFLDGVLLGLQVIAGFGNAGSADHDELLRSTGVDLVVRRAIEQEMWELAGLDRNQISIKARRRIEEDGK